MKHHYGWIIILLGALVVACVGCNSAPSIPGSKTDSTLIYEWSESGNHFYVRKIKIDGQEYIIASTSQGVSIIAHNVWIPTPSGGGDYGNITIDSTYTETDTITIKGSIGNPVWEPYKLTIDSSAIAH